MLLWEYTPSIKNQKLKSQSNDLTTLEKLEINGCDQWINIRTQDITNPILLFLHGGPGVPSMPTSYINYKNTILERHFTVVNWDQRGAGKSFSEHIDPSTMTISQFIDDGIELTKILLTRFNKQKLYLIGHSWGSLLGIKMAFKCPNFFEAYVGVSQLLDLVKGEELALKYVKELAQKHNNRKAIEELSCISAPTEDTEDPFTSYLQCQRKWMAKLGGMFHSGQKIEPIMLSLGALFSPEYKFSDMLKISRGLDFSSLHMWKEMMKVNIFSEIKSLDLPVYFLMGRHDHIAPPTLLEEYYELLNAPFKKLIWFENSAHGPNMEELEKYERTLLLELLSKDSFNN